MFGLNSEYGDMLNDTARDSRSQLLGNPTAIGCHNLLTTCGGKCPPSGNHASRRLDTLAGGAVRHRRCRRPVRGGDSCCRRPAALHDQPGECRHLSGQSVSGHPISNRFGAAVDALHVNNLTQNIGGTGIVFNPAGGPLTFNLFSNTGNFGIISKGNGIQLNSAGTLFSVDHTGNINARNIAIRVESFGDGENAGPVTVRMAGNANAGDGIFARSQVGSLDTGSAGAAAIIFKGNIISDGFGISARSTVNLGNDNRNAGISSVVSKGDILARCVGIEAISSVTGTGNASGVSVDSAGNIITQTGFFGIEARSSDRDRLGTDPIFASRLYAEHVTVS
ncbi:hypothetical protein HNQ36_000344 [Afipia massiliensis]|uniref:Uncharacterized protein n=1 Tax=Afipia massiliensis TaxID=211460 RepID=A0A840N0Y5_9BRAD|nr:hypothetical protein [Afipia massiliensis]MBB5050396.1 hypothetical protein [Afipia massiliensis]